MSFCHNSCYKYTSLYALFLIGFSALSACDEPMTPVTTFAKNFCNTVANGFVQNTLKPIKLATSCFGTEHTPEKTVSTLMQQGQNFFNEQQSDPFIEAASQTGGIYFTLRKTLAYMHPFMKKASVLGTGYTFAKACYKTYTSDTFKKQCDLGVSRPLCAMALSTFYIPFGFLKSTIAPSTQFRNFFEATETQIRSFCQESFAASEYQNFANALCTTFCLYKGFRMFKVIPMVTHMARWTLPFQIIMLDIEKKNPNLDLLNGFKENE